MHVTNKPERGVIPNKQGGRFPKKRRSAFKAANKQRGGHAVHFAGSSSTGTDALPPPHTLIEQHFAQVPRRPWCMLYR